MTYLQGGHWGSTMTATNHDDQLGEIYPMMLNDLNCTFGVSFSRFHCCGRHGIGPWPLTGKRQGILHWLGKVRQIMVCL